MSKTLVILCDGTRHNKYWDDSPQSHVTRLVDPYVDLLKDQATDASPAATEGVFVHYVAGVGAKYNDLRSRFGWAGKWYDLAFGTFFAGGANDDIIEAYRWLCERYQPGDKVVMYGWSRGAYIARSLVGMIRCTGLATENPTPERCAINLDKYRSRELRDTPWSEEMLAYRAKHSPKIHMDDEEARWRTLHDVDHGERFKIAYLGIWDTVGMKGVPGVFNHFFARYLKGVADFTQLPFHDNQLSSIVQSARHAMALDEDFRFFPVVPWSRHLDALNPQKEVSSDNAKPFQQKWFAGGHAVVGGSDDGTDLSRIAGRWVLEGAQVAGLPVPAQSEENLNAEDNLHTQPKPWYRRWFWPALESPFVRSGPSNAEEVHESVLHRVARNAKHPGWYNPRTLNRVKPSLYRILGIKPPPPPLPPKPWVPEA